MPEEKVERLIQSASNIQRALMRIDAPTLLREATEAFWPRLLREAGRRGLGRVVDLAGRAGPAAAGGAGGRDP